MIQQCWLRTRSKFGVSSRRPEAQVSTVFAYFDGLHRDDHEIIDRTSVGRSH